MDQCPKHTTKAKILRVLVLIYYLSSLLPENNLFNLNMLRVAKGIPWSPAQPTMIAHLFFISLLREVLCKGRRLSHGSAVNKIEKAIPFRGKCLRRLNAFGMLERKAVSSQTFLLVKQFLAPILENLKRNPLGLGLLGSVWVLVNQCSAHSANTLPQQWLHQGYCLFQGAGTISNFELDVQSQFESKDIISTWKDKNLSDEHSK